MAQFAPCTLKRHEEGDATAFQAKLTGAGNNDMCNMSELTKDSILGLLKDRFKKEIVYTYVGDIVVSVNPFKNVGCVGKSIRSRYKKGGAQNAQLLMPHVYHLVDSTYAQMMTEQKSQSILISGESGAGKTEAMKIALTYIGEVSNKPSGGGGGKGGGKEEADPVAKRLMQTNPVMEAIGNAKTVRNNNSSRFGKHFDVQFDDKGSILGAFTSIYLLEKPRITEHMKGERNYHVRAPAATCPDLPMPVLAYSSSLTPLLFPKGALHGVCRGRCMRPFAGRARDGRSSPPTRLPPTRLSLH